MSIKDSYQQYIKPVIDKIFYYLFINKPIFIGFLVAFTISVICSLAYLQIRGPIYPKASEITEYPLDRGVQIMPVEFNLAHGEFTEKEVLAIRDSLSAWTKFTSGKAQFILNEDWEPVQEFNVSFYETYEKNTIWMKTGDEDEVAKLFLRYSISADGFSVGNFIVVIDQFQKMTEQRLYIIVSHEVGHKLGLEHIKADYPALMNIGGNKGEFTVFDKIMFCELYKC